MNNIFGPLGKSRARNPRPAAKAPLLTSSVGKARLGLLAVLVLLGLVTSSQAATFCIDYGYHTKQENFRRYDFAILSPYGQTDMQEGHSMGKKFFAYISAGEVARGAQYYQQAVAAGIPFLTENPNWASMVVDLTSPLWAPFVVQQLAEPAADKGYDGFFLDTMDSYYLTPSGQWAAQETGLIHMVQELKRAYPSKQIIINRGFPVFNSLKNVVDGMLVEGLYWSYPGEAQSASGTSWLRGQLEQVQAANTPVYIVDYMADASADSAAQVANQISSLGYHPLIVRNELDGTVLAPLPPEGGSQTDPPVPPPMVEPKMRVVRMLHFPIRDGYPTFRFRARADTHYEVEFTDSKRSGVWTYMMDIPAKSVTRMVEIVDYSAEASPRRIYRVRKEIPN